MTITQLWPHMRSAVLLSGGVDSSTLAATPGVEAAVFVDYRQRHIRERTAARSIAMHYDLELIEVDLYDYGRQVVSALTGDLGTPVPQGHYSDDTMAATVVPGRNAVLISVAAGIAASRGLSQVLTAVHAGDHPIYPDCRPEFIDAISRASELGCGVGVAAPFVDASKAEIVALGSGLEVPYERTWSCYEGGTLHCGRCGTCVERAEAFALAGVADPTSYVDPEYWRLVVSA